MVEHDQSGRKGIEKIHGGIISNLILFLWVWAI